MNYYLIDDDNGREHLRQLLREAEQEHLAREFVKAQTEATKPSKLRAALLKVLSAVIR